MSDSTAKYVLVVAGGEPEGDFEEMANAVSAADVRSAADSAEVQVVHVATGVQVYVKSPAEPGRYFNPWCRVEQPKHAAPFFTGFVTAYQRKRIQATVYRALDHTGWRVHDGRTGNWIAARTTKEACGITKEMRLGRTL